MLSVGNKFLFPNFLLQKIISDIAYPKWDSKKPPIPPEANICWSSPQDWENTEWIKYAENQLPMHKTEMKCLLDDLL